MNPFQTCLSASLALNDKIPRKLLAVVPCFAIVALCLAWTIKSVKNLPVKCEESATFIDTNFVASSKCSNNATMEIDKNWTYGAMIICKCK